MGAFGVAASSPMALSPATPNAQRGYLGYISKSPVAKFFNLGSAAAVGDKILK